MVVGLIHGVAALTGFSYKIMYGRFRQEKKSGYNKKVTIGRGSSEFIKPYS